MWFESSNQNAHIISTSLFHPSLSRDFKINHKGILRRVSHLRVSDHWTEFRWLRFPLQFKLCNLKKNEQIKNSIIQKWVSYHIWTRDICCVVSVNTGRAKNYIFVFFWFHSLALPTQTNHAWKTKIDYYYWYNQ